MIKGPPQTSVLDDADFIRENYTSYFSSFNILHKDLDEVRFLVCPVGDAARNVTVSMSRQCYRVTADSALTPSNLVGDQFESFEQLLRAVMGDAAFSNLVLQLTINKLVDS